MPRRSLPLVATVALACFACSCARQPHPTGAADEVARFQTVTINNVEPRRDVTGAIVDAHDGCLQFFNGRYYLYGTAYGASAGFSINNRYRVYSSPDLERWTLEGELLPPSREGTYYRPYVAFNPHTRKYVLWFNWYPKLWDGQLAVAVSDTPEGPFAIVNDNVQVSQAAARPGDGSLFVDDDGTGYFVYTVIGQGHAIRVERLTRDYCGSTGEVSDVLATGCEAPVMFRRGPLYYVLFDSNCCFCPQGSGARVFTATSPLGPFTERGNLNRDASGKPIIAAQQTWVARIPTRAGDAYLWMGDRWGSRPDGIKGHDFLHWSAPLEFTASGDIRPLKSLAEQPHWQATVRVGPERKPREQMNLWPKRTDPNPLKTDPCTGQPLPPEPEY